MTTESGPVTVQCVIGCWCNETFKVEGRLIHDPPEALWKHLNEIHPLECAMIRPKLALYLRGGLGDDILDERILMHLAGCESCREARVAATAARTRGIIQALTDLGMIPRTQPG